MYKLLAPIGRFFVKIGEPRLAKELVWGAVLLLSACAVWESTLISLEQPVQAAILFWAGLVMGVWALFRWIKPLLPVMLRTN